MKNQCLKGAALQACQHLETLQEVWAMLARLYGNPKELIAAKLRDLVAGGKCPSDPLRAKEWCIRVTADLNNVKKIADNHGLSTLFTLSP